VGKKEVKIILAGLDNAGKSSMLVGLRRMYGFEEDVKRLKPTIRIDYYRREFLNMKLNFFDMGGQVKFRESYLKRPIYFESVNVMIFLIDIQDEERFTESVDYLGKILGVLKETEYPKEYPVYVCFSKADFDLVQNNVIDFLSRMKMIKDLIKKYYSDFKFNYYSTSIYNLYTIIKMISSGLSQYLDGYEKIQDILMEFGEDNDVKQALLFDHTGLVIADYFKAEGEGLELQNRIDGIISGHLEFFGQLEDLGQLEITSTRGVDGTYMNCCYQFKLYDDSELTEENLPEILKKKKTGDPMYANYYFSMIVNLDISIPAENQIPSAIGRLGKFIDDILVSSKSEEKSELDE
jgi:GTPase SAR1 family protein